MHVWEGSVFSLSVGIPFCAFRILSLCNIFLSLLEAEEFRKGIVLGFL